MWTVGQTVYWAQAQDIFVRGKIVSITHQTNRQGLKVYYAAEFISECGIESVFNKLESFFFSTMKEAMSARDSETSYFADDV